MSSERTDHLASTTRRLTAMRALSRRTVHRIAAGSGLLLLARAFLGCTVACEDLERAARDRVFAVVEANQGCASDDECVVIGVSASCFDACSSAVNVAGKSAVEDEIAAVNAEECVPFSEQRCFHPTPPCTPPGTAACVDGKCVEK